jgi:acid phosphatase
VPLKQSFAATLLSALLFAASGPASPAAPVGLDRVQHIVVLYLENRSFDNLYGLFPGADGLQDLERIAPQIDEHGEPYKTLPRSLDTNLRTPDMKEGDPSPVDPRVPANLPNRPFRIDWFVPLDALSGDLVHRFHTEQRQIHGGKMDRFIVEGNSGSLPLGYYDGSSLAMWKLAQEFTLADHFFHAAFGGSFLNHFWLICACSPEIRPEDWAILDHKMLGDLSALPPQDPEVWDDHVHFWAVNTMESVFPPHNPKTPAYWLLPPQTHATIGDRLSEKGISWAWYAGGWAEAVSGHADNSFQYHHQPFAYFAKYGGDTPGRAEHLKDEGEFLSAIDTDTLPSVAFWKPLGRDDEHPGYAAILTGDRKAADIVDKIRKSAAWESTIIIVTHDENGGTWDHVAPPQIDKWGPGTRVPAIVISPFAKKSFVDHTIYDTTSILRLIEERFDLQPLGDRDARAVGLSNAFDFAAAGPGRTR